MHDEAVIAWLMEGDPAVRWRVLRDLVPSSEEDVAAERRRIGAEGWGAELLARQDPEGTWAQGLYGPKWTSTFYTLLLLRDLGLEGNDQTTAGAQILFDRGRRQDGGWSFSSSRVTVAPRAIPPGPSETCISGMGLGILARFLPAQTEGQDELVRYLLAEQMDDGGWNCALHRGATHASFNTTILALEGLDEFERLRGSHPGISAARRRGEDFLLQHRLFRSHTTGEVARKAFLHLSQPGTWHYDILRGLDYFRTNDRRDERLADAIDVLASRRRKDGRWPSAYRWPSQHWFDLEPPREPGRLNTARALAILRWWNAGETEGS